jgi:hypothetical protein
MAIRYSPGRIPGVTVGHWRGKWWDRPTFGREDGHMAWNDAENALIGAEPTKSNAWFRGGEIAVWFGGTFLRDARPGRHRRYICGIAPRQVGHTFLVTRLLVELFAELVII